MRTFWLAIASVLVVSWSASAQGTKAYDDVIKRAITEYDSGNWEEARVLFRQAHELEPNARTWRGLGITAFELRRYVDAIGELEAARADPRKPLTEKQRGEVEGLLARAREFVSVYRVTVAPGAAEVLVDGKPTTLKDGQLFLDPGDHAIVVRAPGYQERRADLKVGGGEQDELSIQLAVAQPLEPTAPSSSEQPSAAPPAPAPRPHLWTWVLGGAAVATAGVSVGMWVAANGKLDDFNACEGDVKAMEACQDRNESSGEKYLLLSRVGFGLSGALLAGAVTAFVLEGRRKQASSGQTAVLLSPTGLALRGTF